MRFLILPFLSAPLKKSFIREISLHLAHFYLLYRLESYHPLQAHGSLFLIQKQPLRLSSNILNFIVGGDND